MCFGPPGATYEPDEPLAISLSTSLGGRLLAGTEETADPKVAKLLLLMAIVRGGDNRLSPATVDQRSPRCPKWLASSLSFSGATGSWIGGGATIDSHCNTCSLSSWCCCRWGSIFPKGCTGVRLPFETGCVCIRPGDKTGLLGGGPSGSRLRGLEYDGDVVSIRMGAAWPSFTLPALAVVFCLPCRATPTYFASKWASPAVVDAAAAAGCAAGAGAGTGWGMGMAPREAILRRPTYLVSKPPCACSRLAAMASLPASTSPRASRGTPLGLASSLTLLATVVGLAAWAKRNGKGPLLLLLLPPTLATDAGLTDGADGDATKDGADGDATTEAGESAGCGRVCGCGADTCGCICGWVPMSVLKGGESAGCSCSGTPLVVEADRDRSRCTCDVKSLIKLWTLSSSATVGQASGDEVSAWQAPQLVPWSLGDLGDK